MNFSPLCINTAYFQWIRCPDSGVSRCRRTVRPLVYSSRVSNINLDATEFTTPSSGGAAARGQRPQRDLPTFQTLRRTRAAPRSTCSGNYHDEEKTLGMILICVSTWGSLLLSNPSLTPNGPGASLGWSVPVRAHLYVTNFTRGVQVGVE